MFFQIGYKISNNFWIAQDLNEFICTNAKKVVLLRSEMKNLLSEIYSSASLRNVGKLLSANIFAQAIGLLVYPVLTRIYTPEDFGLLNLFVSIAGVLIVLSGMEWYNAIVLPKREEEARAIVHLCLLSVGIWTLLIAATIPFSGTIAHLFKSPLLSRYYWLLPVYVMAMGVWNILNYWYIRNKSYGRISGYQISQSLFSAGYKTSFGWAGWLQGGLIYATILSPLCSLVLSICISGKKMLAPLAQVDKTLCASMARQYANFPKYSMPRALVNIISGNLPVLMLAPLFGLTEVGFIGMALTLSLSPIQIVVKSIYQVLYQHIAQRVNSRQPIGALMRRYIGNVLLVSVPFFIGLYFILPWLTETLLGASWRMSGIYIRIFLPWILMITITTSINFIPDIFGKQSAMLWIEIVYLILRVIALAIGGYTASLVTALTLFSVSGVIVLLGQLVWFIVLTRHYDKDYEKCE